MFERHVYLKLEKGRGTDARRAELAEAATRHLAGIPGVAGIAVGLPADEGSKAAWDLAVVVRFGRLDAIDAYLAHAGHAAFMAAVGADLAVVKAWNFEAR